MARHLIRNGEDVHERPWEQLRWSWFKHLAAGKIDALVGESVFLFLLTLGSGGEPHNS